MASMVLLQPVSREVEIEPNLFVGASEDFVDAIGEIALGQGFEPLGDRSDDARLLVGDFGAFLRRLCLRFAFDTPLLFGLLAGQLGLLALFDTAFLQRRVAQRDDCLANLTDSSCRSALGTSSSRLPPAICSRQLRKP